MYIFVRQYSSFFAKKKKKLKNFIFYFFEELYVLHHVQWLKKISVYSV